MAGRGRPFGSEPRSWRSFSCWAGCWAAPFGPLGVGASVIIAYLVGLAAAQRLTADLLQLDLLNLFVKPLLAAAAVVGVYFGLTRLLPVNDWPLLVRVLAKGAYAVAGYYSISFLLQPHATLERLRYVYRLLR